MVLTLEEGHYYNFHDVGFVTYKIYSFFFYRGHSYHLLFSITSNNKIH